MGLVEEEWMETLATLDPEDITYIDFVSKGKELSKDFKQKVTLFKKCKHCS
jgi:5'-nucleotidase